VIAGPVDSWRLPLQGLLPVPSCSQKRILFFGEHANERLLLRLPHRRIVFTVPRVLRLLFRLDHCLFGEVSKLV
jgi:hypothetical protein